MLESYFLTNKNARLSKIQYQRKYPDRRTPSHTYFRMLSVKIRTAGSFDRKKSSRSIDEEIETNILSLFVINNRLSVREVAAECDCSIGFVHKVLKKYNFKAFKLQPVQKLHPGDNEMRIHFCRWLLSNIEEDDSFLGKIIWTDESNFSNRSHFNRRNTHVWSQDRPHEVEEIETQRRFSTNVWCAIMCETIYGPYFYEGTLNSEGYYNILIEQVPIILENVPLAARRNIIYQHDGAPPHRTTRIRDYLNMMFNTWIGANGPLHWPARSPDLTPLDFSLWGTVKDRVYTEEITDLIHLKSKITAAFRSISRDQMIGMMKNLKKRALLCIRHNGGNFEQYL